MWNRCVPFQVFVTFTNTSNHFRAASIPKAIPRQLTQKVATEHTKTTILQPSTSEAQF